MTIPAALRKELHLDKETTLNVVKVGDVLILTPRKLIGDQIAQSAQKEMKKAGLTLEDLLKDLEKQRERYNRERYGG
ncbi:MAG: AbrB/MazE/SpoVT family DNA-binding domain-containing protein [Nitrospirota bacterium]